MTDETLSRRRFAASIAAGATAPMLAVRDSVAAEQAPKATDGATTPSLVDRMLELIRQQYADRRLDEAALAEIREELESQVARSQRLAAFPLMNGDEPGFHFAAYRRT